MTTSHMRPPRCPDTVNGYHGPADVYGRCPWCGFKYTHARGRAQAYPYVEGDLVEAYRRTYDPDYDS